MHHILCQQHWGNDLQQKTSSKPSSLLHEQWAENQYRILLSSASSSPIHWHGLSTSQDLQRKLPRGHSLHPWAHEKPHSSSCSHNHLQGLYSSSYGVCFSNIIWSGAGTTALRLLDRLQRKALRLLKIDNPSKAGIHPLEHIEESGITLYILPPFLPTTLPWVDWNRAICRTSTRFTRYSTVATRLLLACYHSKVQHRALLILSSYIPRTNRFMELSTII